MRKHFLILMLFALLPLAGWAAVENVGFTVTIGATDVALNPATIDQTKADDPNDKNSVYLIYNAQEKALPTPTQIGGQDISQYVINTTWYKATRTATGYEKTGEAIEKIKDAGFYLCEFTVNQGNLQGGHTGVLEIVKRELTVTASDMVNGLNQNDPQNAIAYGSTFDATPVELTWGNWPATLTEEEKAALKTSFGTVNIISDYVPFTTPVTDVTVQEPAYCKVIPVVEYLVSSNYDFKAVNGKLQVVAKNMADGEFTVTTNNRFYNGQSEAPVLVVKDNANPDKALVLDEDYELTYYSASSATQNDALAQAPIHVGNYWFKISGKDGSNYTGQYASVYTYKVRPQRLEISLKNPAVPYKAAGYNLATATLEATSALYDIEGLATGDGVSAITVVLQDGTKDKPAELKDLKTSGNNPTFITEVTDVAFNADGYKLKKITPTFTGTAAGHAEDYDVVIMTPNFKINQAPIKITFKSFSLHEDESAEIKEGIAITTGQNSNVATYLTLSNPNVLAPNVITAYPNVVATESNGVWTISFAKDAKGNQLYPTVKASDANDAGDVTRNYAFELTEGTLTIIADLGILYVTPQADTYGNFAKKGFIKVKVVGGEAADNAKLEALLNNDKVTVKPYLNAQNPQDVNNGKLLDVTAHIEYPNAGTYNVLYDESIYESADWIALKESYDINLTGRPTYTINKAPLKIKLNDQSLNGKTGNAYDGDTKAALVADNKTVEFTGIVDDDLVDGEIPEALYQAVHANFKFVGAVEGKLTGDNLNADAITYNQEKVNDTDEATTPGYFRNAISVDAEHLVFDNYKYNANEDVTKGALYVSAYDNDFSLDEADDDVDVTLEAANTNKKAQVIIKLRRDQDLVSGEGADAQVLHHGKWAAKKWNTMVLPFDVTVAELSQQLGYAIVNVVNPEKTTGTNIAFRLEMNEIPANTPFTVKTNKGIGAVKELTFRNKTIKYVAEPSVEAGGQGYTFNANYAGLTIDKESDGLLKFLYGDMDGWGRVLADKDYSWDIMPFAAYIDLTEATDPNAAREVTFTMEEIDGSTTTIRNISVDTASKLKNATEGWYTIDGIRLQGAPTEKGIYINNGKKVVLK